MLWYGSFDSCPRRLDRLAAGRVVEECATSFRGRRASPGRGVVSRQGLARPHRAT